jgi:hypothetical protein
MYVFLKPYTERRSRVVGILITLVMEALGTLKRRPVSTVQHLRIKKVKLSRYTPWWHMGGEEI